MAFCPSCGAPVEGRFCSRCGAIVNAGDNAGDQPATPPPQAGTAAAPLDDNVAGALCYLGWFITGVLFLVLEPYSRNRNLRFHAFQSIFMNVAVVAAYIVIGFLAAASAGFLAILFPLLGLASIALWLILMVKTYQGQKVVLPVIGPMAEKQA